MGMCFEPDQIVGRVEVKFLPGGFGGGVGIGTRKRELVAQIHSWENEGGICKK